MGHAEAHPFRTLLPGGGTGAKGRRRAGQGNDLRQRRLSLQGIGQRIEALRREVSRVGGHQSQVPAGRRRQRPRGTAATSGGRSGGPERSDPGACRGD